MKSRGILIKKEKLGNNYKLTFTKEKKSFFLILHGRQRKIFHWLKIRKDYCFLYQRGYKYAFVRKIEKLVEKSQVNAKNIFTQDLLNKLSVSLTVQASREQNHIFLSQTQKAQETIQWLFLKHQELALTPFFSLSERERKEVQILEQLKVMFLVDVVHA